PDDVGSLPALRPHGHIELDAIALRQGLESVAADGREMDEHLLASVILDEAEALRLVEPLDLALLPAGLSCGRCAMGPGARRGLRGRLGGSAPAGLEAVAAEDRAVPDRLERHLRGLAAVGAHRVVHLTRAARLPRRAVGRAGRSLCAGGCGAVPAPALPLLAAALAAGGRVGQPLLAVERLLAGREQELFPAVHAPDGLIFAVCHDVPRCLRKRPARIHNSTAPTAQGCRGG